jgi:2-polyprenyl-6-methoxyphenol hydroxylase-like FAD-dependent oxidoreductase
MRDAPDLYFDSISRVDMPARSAGRVVLVGDAGYGATVGGLGTGTAMVGAYVLAGELAAAEGDHRIAFTRYERLMRNYAMGCQKLANNAGPFLAPPTAAAIRRRNRLYKVLSSPLLAGMLNKMTTRAANAITLPDYPG